MSKNEDIFFKINEMDSALSDTEIYDNTNVQANDNNLFSNYNNIDTFDINDMLFSMHRTLLDSEYLPNESYDTMSINESTLKIPKNDNDSYSAISQSHENMDSIFKRT